MRRKSDLVRSGRYIAGEGSHGRHHHHDHTETQRSPPGPGSRPDPGARRHRAGSPPPQGWAARGSRCPVPLWRLGHQAVLRRNSQADRVLRPLPPTPPPPPPPHHHPPTPPPPHFCFTHTGGGLPPPPPTHPPHTQSEPI